MALNAINPPGSGTLNITEAVYAISVDPANPSLGALGTATNPLQTGTSQLQTTADLTTIRVGPITAITASTAIVSAVAAKKTRVYRMRVNVGAAQVFTILDGVTVLERLNFAGAAVLTYDFFTRPWYTTSTNAALNYTLSTVAETNFIMEYVTA